MRASTDTEKRLPMWKNDKKWSDQFIPEIKGILGQILISEAPLTEDREHNTDLMVFKMDSVRIGCRIRRKQYMNYVGQFTIRCSRPSGQKTEMAKILEGWGDIFFYGFEGDDGELGAYGVGDLSVFRLHIVTTLAKMQAGQFPGEKRENKDDSSAFRAYNWKDMPPGFVLRQKNIIP